MALLTQKAILSTFEEMLYEMPFDKISVTALVKRCGVSSNTFYYHYQDIFMLLREWLKIELSTGNIQEGKGDWKDEAKHLLRWCQDNKRIVNHIFSSISRDQLERHLSKIAGKVFYDAVLEYVVDTDVPSIDIKVISEFCEYAFIGFFLKFVWDGMEADIDLSVEKIGALFDNFMETSIKQAYHKAH